MAARYRSFGDNHGLWVHDLRRPYGGSSQLLREHGVRWPALRPGSGTMAFTVERSATDHDIDVIGAFGTQRRTLIGGPTDDRAPILERRPAARVRAVPCG